MKDFNREDLEFYLIDKPFKGLSKEYILEAIFNNDIQNKWQPQVGDIIVGPTGNIFVISGMDRLHKSLGGNMYYFGGSSCNRTGGNVLDSTYCYTANESGKYIHPLNGEQENLYHSSIRKFRYVPYPHEKIKLDMSTDTKQELPAIYPLIDNRRWYVENGTVYNEADEMVKIVLLHDNGSYSNLPNEIAMMISSALNRER